MARLLKSTLVAAVLFVGTPPATGAVDWIMDLSAGLEHASRAKKPILVDAWATWCQPCRAMDQDLWNRDEIPSLIEKFVPIRIDVSESFSVAQRLGIDGVPTVLFLDPWGNEIGRMSGFDDAEPFLKILKEIPEDFGTVETLGLNLRDNPNHMETLVGFGRFYYVNGLFEISNHFYDRARTIARAREDSLAASDLTLAIAWNDVKSGNVRLARRKLERLLKQHPDLARRDVALFALVVANLELGKTQKAHEVYATLRAEFPDSSATTQAARRLEAAGSE